LIAVLLPPDAPVVLLIDGTLERRWGCTIALKGRFHDAVRSQSGHVVTTEGIHWLCLMLLVRLPWCAHPWALPCLSVPTRTPTTSTQLGKRHRTVPEYADLLIRLVRRGQPERELILIGDSTFAVASLGHTCRRCGVRLVSRLRALAGPGKKRPTRAGRSSE
jgi:DDE superfamily endonuclease